jgi:hypothetical protein
VETQLEGKTSTRNIRKENIRREKIGQIWERRTNKEILEMYGELSISNVA